MVVNGGMNVITGLLAGVLTGGPRHLHWGTGTTAPALGNTTLETARGETPVEGAASQQTLVSPNDGFDVVGTLYVEGSPADISEAGLFRTTDLFSRVVFDPIGLQVDDGLQLTFRTRFVNG